MKKYRRLSKIEKSEVIKKHFEGKVSQTRLAKEYDTNRTTISLLCRRYGGSPLLKDYKMDTEQIIRLYTEDKKSVNQIAALFNTTTNPIKRRLALARVVKRTSRRTFWEETVPHYFLKMKIWVAKVIEADEMKCRMCGCENSRDNRLESHHIIPVRDMVISDLLFDLSNGICLCRKCHMKIHFHEKEYEVTFQNLIQMRSSE